MTDWQSPHSLGELRRAYESGDEPMAYLPYARALLAEKRLARALEICLQGLRRRRVLAGETLLAHIYFAMGRYEETLGALTEVLRQAPESFSANLLFARTQARRGELEEASEIVGDLREKNPQARDLAGLAEQIRAELADRGKDEVAVEKAEPGVQRPATFDEFKLAVVERLRRHPGVSHCAFQSPEEAEAGQSEDWGGLLGILMPQARQIAAKLDLGEPMGIMLDCENGSVWAYRTGEEFLVVEFSASIPPGRMRGMIEQCLSWGQ